MDDASDLHQGVDSELVILPAEGALATYLIFGKNRRVRCRCKPPKKEPPKKEPEIDRRHPRYPDWMHPRYRTSGKERPGHFNAGNRRFRLRKKTVTLHSAVPDNQPASTHSPYCDECMSIDFDEIGSHGNGGRRIAWANIDTCPMCAFFHAFIVRQGFGLSDKTNFILFEDMFDGWNTMDVVRPRHSSYDTGPSVSIQPARVRSPPRLDEIYEKRRVYPRLEDYSFIADWLDGCARFHGNDCFDSLSSFDLIPGLRFIDCMARRIIPASEAVDKVYVTLSYVWGASSGSTDEGVEEAGSVSSLPTHLPNVVKDSMRVVKELGFRYLWVDRYCIPQINKRAKHIQIQLMGTIYARSTITIIAAAGEDAEYGLPGVGLRERIPQLWVKHSNCPQALMVHSQPGNDIKASSWSTRGWTYQEALLSKRRLVFTDNQVFFQCQSMTCEESQALSTHRRILTSRDPVFPKPADFKDASTVWERISEFMERNLSFERDALDAISGILNMYRTESSRDSGVAFLCGMPLFSQRSVHQPGDVITRLGEEINQEHKSFCETSVLTRGLLWTGEWRDKPVDTLEAELSSKRLERPRRSGFPSWTWVGWKNTSQYALKVRSPYSNSHFAKCAIRAVYEDRQRDLDWEKDAEQILENSALGLNPRFLDIKGTCFDVTVAWVDRGWPCWVYTEPLPCFLSQWSIRNIPPNTLEEGVGKVHKLVALLLAKDVDSLDKTVSMGFLLLKPVEYSAGGWVYERVASTWDVLDADPRWAADLSREFEAGLEERELRLR